MTFTNTKPLPGFLKPMAFRIKNRDAIFALSLKTLSLRTQTRLRSSAV